MIFYYDGVNEPKGYMVYELATPTTPTVTPAEINELYEEFGINGHTTTIQFKDGDNPLTVYDGTLDVVNGTMTVDRAIVDMGDLYWSYISDAKLFTATIQGIKSGVYTDTNLISSIYPVKPMSYSQFDYGMRYNSATAIGVKNPSYTDATAFKTAMNGVQLVYELATPLTIQLTPTQVKSLLGSNNVWADTGNVLEGEYFSRSESVKLPLPSEFVDDQATHITIPNFSSYDKLKIDYKSINSQLQTVTISISSLPENNNPDWGQGGDIYIVNGFYYLVMSRDSTGIWFKECGNPLQQLTAIRI
jgi:hypothetical protein